MTIELAEGPLWLCVPWLAINTIYSHGREPQIDFLAGPGLRFKQLIAKFDGGGHLYPRWEPNTPGLRPTNDDSFSPSGWTLREQLFHGLARIGRFHQWSKASLSNEETAPRGRFRVPDWEGVLEIPVDAIRFAGFGRRASRGPAHCHLQLLPHLELAKVVIFDRDLDEFRAAGGFGLGPEGECIRHRGLRQSLGQALQNWDLRRHILEVLRGNNQGHEFVFPLWRGYDPDHPSLLRFTGAGT
jgi:hypothetical protein